ncbi:MAG: long-chain fatty acid--CoA ligase [Alphaproteobacteria bacterium]
MTRDETLPAIGERTLPQWLAWRAADHPECVALRQKALGIWQPVTWRQYFEQAGAVAHGLAALGYGPGTHVAILSENRREWVIAQMGIGLARGVCVGVYATSPAGEVGYVLDHSGSVVVICEDQEQADKLIEIRPSLAHVRRVVVMDTRGLRRYGDPWLISFDALIAEGERHRAVHPGLIEANLAAQRLDDIALLVYTSGSTGRPKGAMLSWRNIGTAAESAAANRGFGPHDSCLSYLPLCHVAEQLFSVTLGVGAGLQVNFGESLRTVQADLREIAPTAFLGVPRIWEKMHSLLRVKLEEAGGLRLWLFRRGFAACRPFCDVPPKRRSLKQRLTFLLFYWLVFRPLQQHLGLARARVMLSGAAPISPEVLAFFRTIGLPVCEAFGMTETAALGFIQNPSAFITGSVGPPLAKVEARIAEDGELLMRGPMVFQGYYRDEAATRDALKDGWLHTGDLAEEIGGQYRIVGRKKEVLITAGGKNLSPSELENNLKVSPYIKEAIVCGDRRPYLVALVQIDYDNVANWAEREGIAFTGFKNLAENPAVHALIDAEVARANERVAHVAQVRRFELLTKELDHDDDEMTATQKVRRARIHEKYGAAIDRLYGERIPGAAAD